MGVRRSKWLFILGITLEAIALVAGTLACFFVGHGFGDMFLLYLFFGLFALAAAWVTGP